MEPDMSQDHAQGAGNPVPGQGYMGDPEFLQDEDEISLLELLAIILRQRRMILRNTGAAALLALLVSLVLPKYYTATTTMLPPEQSSSASSLLNQLGGAAALMGGGGLGIKNPSDRYVGMLKSVDVENALIKQFDLKTEFKSKTLEEARKDLETNTTITAGKDGFIKIDYTAKSPKEAAAIANAYIAQLNRVMSLLAMTEASQRRLFFEKQLVQVRQNLAASEYELQKIQKSAGIIQAFPEAQEIATVNARLRAEIATKEVQLSAMQIRVTPGNPDYQRLEREVTALKAKLNGTDDPSAAIPAGLPKDSLEYFQKFREMKFNQAVMELLYKQFEMAKIDEAKDYPIIQVLDKATEPERKSKPKKGMIVIMTAIVAFLLSILWVFMVNAWKNLEADPDNNQRIMEIKRLWKFGD